MIKFLLEGGVFLLVGLQMYGIFTAKNICWGEGVLATLVVVGVVIGARLAWIFPATYVARLLPAVRHRDPRPSWAEPTVLGWAGMRGAVTLAAALALRSAEEGGVAYPQQLFLVLAFAVIVATLVIQGATLPKLARRLNVTTDETKEDALVEAAVQHEASRAGRERLDASADGAPDSVVQRLRDLTTSRSNLAWERLGRPDRETPSLAYARLRREMLTAEREVFRVARDSGRIPEEVLRRAQRDMDLEESLLDRGDQ
jgi:CPA1 family monovalent cation:H+ antiporter